MKTRAFIKVSGIVQGVYFRYRTKEQADELGLSGTVQNLRDGSVYIVCEGDDIDVKSLIEWCNHGPRGARVDTVAVEWGEFSDSFDEFSIIY
jgi:acylphosphatase